MKLSTETQLQAPRKACGTDDLEDKFDKAES